MAEGAVKCCRCGRFVPKELWFAPICDPCHRQYMRVDELMDPWRAADRIVRLCVEAASRERFGGSWQGADRDLGWMWPTQETISARTA